jgi:transcriptional regulator with XRE-family HTH domain
MAQDGDEDGVLPLLTAGARLREARLAAGLDIEEIAARTRVSRRHLEAIEQDRYAQLASRTYAVGFSRAYARAVGLDERAIAEAVRVEIDLQEELNPRPARSEHFEPGDPARVPPSSLAWLAGGGAILLFALLFIFWRSFLSPAASMPDLAKDEPKAAAAAGRPAAAPRPTPVAPAGAVRLTAMEDGVWVKVSDAAGEQLFQKEMALNESFTVPATASGAVLATARPDVLQVSVGSRVIGPLRPQQEVLRGVSLDPAALLAPPAPAAGATTAPAGAGSRETSTVSAR